MPVRENTEDAGRGWGALSCYNTSQACMKEVRVETSGETSGCRWGQKHPCPQGGSALDVQSGLSPYGRVDFITKWPGLFYHEVCLGFSGPPCEDHTAWILLRCICMEDITYTIE
jgi:hypothetical protein